MCFTVPVSGEFKCATKTIPVYKVIRYDGTSLFRWLQYLPFSTYAIAAQLKIVSDYGLKEIHEGYHSYSCCKQASDVLDSVEKMRGLRLKVVKMYIPVGSTYMYNELYGEYVSDKLETKSLRRIA